MINHYERLTSSRWAWPRCVVLLGQLAGRSQDQGRREARLVLPKAFAVRATAAQAVGFGGSGKMVATSNGRDKSTRSWWPSC